MSHNQGRDPLLIERERLRYREQARDEYRRLLEDLELRSHRAGMMNYQVSSDHDAMSQWWEYWAFPIGSGLISVVSTYFVKGGIDGFSWTTLFAVNLVTNLLAKGGVDIYRSKTRRANSHTEAGAGWQKLEYTARSYLVQLDNPQLDPETISNRYEDLVAERERVCKLAVVPESYYQKFNDETVFKDIKRRKRMFKRSQTEIFDNQNVEEEEDNSEPVIVESLEKNACQMIVVVLIIIGFLIFMLQCCEIDNGTSLRCTFIIPLAESNFTGEAN